MAAASIQISLGYEVGEMLGFGAFSFARKGRNPETGKTVALKFTKYTEGNEKHVQQQIAEIQKELTILKGIRHLNILSLLDFSQDEPYTTENGTVIKTYCMALELCEGGELFDILYYTGQFNEKLARTFFQQICSGVKACHDRNVAHRDIKAQNVLLGEGFQIKLADFGSSKIWTNGELMRTTRVGTKGYQAPEIILKRGYTSKSDVFSLGVLLFIMLTRKPPFMEAKATDNFFRSIAKGKYDVFWQKHSNPQISDACKVILNGTMTYQPLKRLDLDQVMATPWYNMEVFAPEQIEGHMAKLCKKAHHARSKDTSRNYSNYNSLRGVAGRTPAKDLVPPPSIPTKLKWKSFKVPAHPFLYINYLVTHVTNNLSGFSTTVEEKCEGHFKVAAQIDESTTATVELKVLGFVDEEDQYYLYFERVPTHKDAPSESGKITSDHFDIFTSVFDEMVAAIQPIIQAPDGDEEDGQEIAAEN